MFFRFENGLYNDYNDLERIFFLVDFGDIFNESNIGYEVCNFSNYVDYVVLLVEEEEFVVDGSNLYELIINNILCENLYVFSLEGGCFDCDSKICDIEFVDYFVVDGS